MKHLLVFALSILICASPAAAERSSKRKSASDASLGSLNAAERELLAPHLARGPVVLTEFSNRESELPAIIFASYIEAPAADVAALIASPKKYPSFMRALDTIKVESRHKNMIAYKWTWQLSLFSMTGRNVMNIHPAPKSPTQPLRIDVRSTEGDMGKGRMVWRISPRGRNASTVVFSSRIDLRDANYIASQMASGGNSVNRSINIMLASVMLLGTKKQAEKNAGHAPAAPQGIVGLRRPTVDFAALQKLLRRGDLVLMDLKGNSLQQVAVVGRSGAKVEKMRRLMVDPEEFGKSLVQGSKAKILERTAKGIRFKWGIPIPLIGVGGVMTLRPSKGVIAVDGESGSLSEGQWRFDTHRYPSGEAGLIGWAKFDPANSSKLVRRVIAGNYHFSHGLAVATQLMVVRSLRSRARRFK